MLQNCWIDFLYFSVFLCLLHSASSTASHAHPRRQGHTNTRHLPQRWEQRDFHIDSSEGGRFMKDGRPYRYISGEVHYFRIHDSLWEDRLQRIKAMGLNAIQVYVPWNFHAMQAPGIFDFGTGRRNLTYFLKLAQQNELDVLMRIGPYVCAEWEFGGFPWWLQKMSLHKPNTTYLRTSDKE